MKVSILIANYNNGKFFKDCFKSIVDQTYNHWETIIVDDHSTDNSIEIIKETIGDDARFILYEHPVNQGVGVIKSMLIELANGEVCTFLDPDDAITPGALERHVAKLKKDPEIAFTYSRLVKCDELLNPLQEFRAAMQVPNGDPTFFNCPVQIAPLVCFRKELYNKTSKMDRTKKIAEDQDIYLKMYEVGKVKFVDQTDYLYRGHAGGISQNANKFKSYEYWAEVIFNAMQRRKLTHLGGQEIPQQYPGSEAVFKMFDYQNKLPYRIIKKLKVIAQNLF